MAVGINIVSDFDAKGIQKAIKQFKELETTAEKSAFVLKKAFLPAVAVLGALSVAGFKAAQAAAADEVEQAKLAQTLQKVVGANEATVASTEQLISAMSKASGTADTELRAALSSLVIGSGDLTVATKGLALAQDIATASSAPLGTVSDALAKAYAGNYKALQRLSPALRELIKDGASTEVIFQQLSNTFGGATANAADTAAGRMKILKNNFNELQESLGVALLPVLEKLTAMLISLFDFIDRNQKLVMIFAIAFGSLAVAVIAFNLAMSISTVVMTAFGASAAAASAAAAPIALTVGAIVLAVIAFGAASIYAYKNFETFRKVVNAVINFIINYLEFLVNKWIFGINIMISGINLLIKAANFFGAGLPLIAKIGEVSFGRIANAAQNSAKQIEANARALQAVKNAERQGTSAVFSPTPEVGGASGGVAKVVETVTEKLKKYIDAIKGVTQAQRSARDATKQVLEANTALSEATQKLSLAQENFNQIIRGYGRDSKQANDKQKLLTKAQRSLEKSGYDVEASIFAVKDAEQKLAQVRADPDSNLVDIREAEIALAQAKLSVADATDAQAEATSALTEAQTMLDEVVNGAKIGSDAYTEALEKVNEAKAAQANASDKVIDALEREKDAVEALTEAEKKRREAGKDLPAALKRTADAAQEVVDVVTSVVAPIVSAVAAVVETVSNVASKTAEQVAVDAGYLTQEQAQALEQRRGIRAFASGGIVTKPMMGLVGEAGAEAIIPLDRLGNMGNTYNISVTAGMGADGKDIGTQIVNALKRYERTNGAIPITVA
jgi:hypothetical protein